MEIDDRAGISQLAQALSAQWLEALELTIRCPEFLSGMLLLFPFTVKLAQSAWNILLENDIESESVQVETACYCDKFKLGGLRTSRNNSLGLHSQIRPVANYASAALGYKFVSGRSRTTGSSGSKTASASKKFRVKKRGLVDFPGVQLRQEPSAPWVHTNKCYHDNLNSFHQ